MSERLFLFFTALVCTFSMDGQSEPTCLFDFDFPVDELKECSVKTIYQNYGEQLVIYDVDRAGNIVSLESKICYDCPVILDTSWIRMSFLYDERGNLIRTEEYAKEGREIDYKLAETIDLTLTYDAEGKLTKETVVHELLDSKEPVVFTSETLFLYDSTSGKLLSKEKQSRDGGLDELLVCTYSRDTAFLTNTFVDFTQTTLEVRNERGQLVYVDNTYQTSSGKITSEITQTFSYSQEGFLLSETRGHNGFSRQTSYVYDSRGDVLRITEKDCFKDPNDEIQESVIHTDFEYNEKGLLIKKEFGYADIPPDKTSVISWQYVYW